VADRDVGVGFGKSSSHRINEWVKTSLVKLLNLVPIARL
jgi:hypothetical protein